MSDDQLDPLDPDLASLLDAEREILPADGEVKARILTRVERTLGLGGPGSSGGGNGGAPSSGGGGPARAVAGLTGKPLALVAFLFGAAAGAGAVAGLRPASPPQIIQVPVFVTAPLPSALPPLAGASAHEAQDVSPPPASASAPARASSDAPGRAPGKDVDLAAERAVLEVARNAVGRGQGAAALAALERHAAEFPRGRLAEEREALWIQALQIAGRSAEARARAERFRARFPKSFLRPAVDATLEDDSVTERPKPAQSPR